MGRRVPMKKPSGNMLLDGCALRFVSHTQRVPGQDPQHTRTSSLCETHLPADWSLLLPCVHLPSLLPCVGPGGMRGSSPSPQPLHAQPRWVFPHVQYSSSSL